MTYRAHSCLCCGSARYDAYPALVAPFLASYVFAARPRPTRLLQCRDCGFRFFEERLTDAESARLYSGYRGERYFRARHRREPWYTRKVNDGIGEDVGVARARRALVGEFIGRHADTGGIETVLDFGGDRGQMIPDLGKDRYVYEISGMEPVAGVTSIQDTKDLGTDRFDLTLLSHVLEHVSEPRTILDQLLPVLKRRGLLYVEVPLERVSLRWVRRSSRYDAYLRAVGRADLIATAVDFYSTLFRVRCGAVPPLGFVKMHEHINFFDERSLASLLARCGFDVIATERPVIRSALGETAVISALARAPG